MYEYLRIYEYEYVEFLVPSHDYREDMRANLHGKEKSKIGVGRLERHHFITLSVE